MTNTIVRRSQFPGDNSVEASFNVGAPYVVLTSNPEVLETQSLISEEDEYQGDTVFLSLQEGNLISFTESYASTEETNDANVSITFLDPELKIVPRLFKNTFKRLYQGYYQNIFDIVNAPVVSPAVPPGLTPEFKEELKSLYGDPFTLDGLSLRQQIALFENNITSATLQEGLNPSGVDLYLKYGMGVDSNNSSVWRKIQIVKFTMVQDTNGNSTVDLVGVFPPQRDSINVISDRTRSYPTGTSPLDDGVYIANVPIFRGELRDPRESRRQPLDPSRPDLNLLGPGILSKVEFNNIPILTSLLESLYQSFLINSYKTNPKYRPFIFLSPLVAAKFSEILAIEKTKNKVEYDIDVNSYDLNIIANILYKAGIDFIPETRPSVGATALAVDPGIVNNQVFGPIVTNGSRRRKGIETLTYYLGLYKKPFPDIDDPRAAVYKSIQMLYSELGITEVGMEGPEILQANLVGLPRPITNPDHARAFVKQFCEPYQQGSTDLFKNEYAAEVVAKSKEVKTGSQLVVVPGPVVTSYVADTFITVNYGDISKTTTNFDFIDITKITEYDIEVFADNAFTHSLIFPVVPDYSLEVLKTYQEEVVKQFKYVNSAVLDLVTYDNGHKFIFSGDKLKSDYRDYLIAAGRAMGIVDTSLGSDLLNIPDEFGVTLNTLVAPVLKSIPVFIANKDNSNVYEVINQERDLSYATLLSTFSLFKGAAAKSLGDIINGSKPVRPALEDAKLSRVVESVIRNSFTNNVTLTCMLRNLQDSISSGDQVTKGEVEEAETQLRTALQKLLDQTKDVMVQSNNLTNKNLDYEELSMLLVYLQALANQVSVINIKTVPFFQINFPYWLTKPALFLHHSTFYALLENNLPAKGFLSGVYIITGYEHTIDGSNCHSKFYLQRHATGTDAISKVIKQNDKK